MLEFNGPFHILMLTFSLSMDLGQLALDLEKVPSKVEPKVGSNITKILNLTSNRPLRICINEQSINNGCVFAI